MNDGAEKVFVLTLRHLEQKRDMSLLTLESIINEPVEAYSIQDKIHEIERVTREAMEAEQMIEFLKDKFTQTEQE
jgi:hypothetical protein